MLIAKFALFNNPMDPSPILTSATFINGPILRLLSKASLSSNFAFKLLPDPSIVML